MSYSDNYPNVHNQADYIDLEAALAEEELASVGYGSHNGFGYMDGTFKLSFKSYDDNAVQRLRHSLITPLSASNNEGSVNRTHLRIKGKKPEHTAYSTRVDSEPAWRSKINLSPTHSVADSLAHYNKIVDDCTEIDFVNSDLKDFMGSYTIGDIMIRSDYSTPSSHNPHRYSQNTVMTGNGYRKDTASDMNRISPDSQPLSQVNKHIEGCASCRGSMQLELASKPAVSEQMGNTALNLSIPHPASTSTEFHQQERRKYDVPSIHQVAQKPIETPQKRFSTKQEQDVPPPVSSRYSQTQPAADPTKQFRDIPSSTGRYPQQHVSSTGKTLLTKESIKKHLRDVANTSSWDSLRRLQSEETTTECQRKNSITTRHNIAAESRYVQRRTSTDKLKSLIGTPNIQCHNFTSTSRYAQRPTYVDKPEKIINTPTAQRTDVITKAQHLFVDKNNTINESSRTQHHNITKSSRYAQRCCSKDHFEQIDKQPKPQARDISTITSRYLQRHLSSDILETKQMIEPRTRAASIRIEPKKSVQRRSSSNRNSWILDETYDNHLVSDMDNSNNKRYSMPSSHIIMSDSDGKVTSYNIKDHAPTYTTSYHSENLSQISSFCDSGETQSNSSRNSSYRDSEKLRSTFTRKSSFRTSTGYAPADVSNIEKRASYHGGDSSNYNVPQLHRSRSISVPSNELIDECPAKNSLLPVLSTKIRKYSNSLYSKSESVPENEFAAQAKEVRFSMHNNYKVRPSTSHSTDDYSNSTTSSQSGDFDTGPATPPRYSYIDQPRYGKKPTRSVETVLEQAKQRRARTVAIINGNY